MVFIGAISGFLRREQEILHNLVYDVIYVCRYIWCIYLRSISLWWTITCSSKDGLGFEHTEEYSVSALIELK